MPWYFALSGSILIILIGIYKKLNIGLTMLCGALALGLLAGLPGRSIFAALADGLLNPITIMLTASVILLGILSHVLKETGALEEIICNLQAITTDLRIISAAVPMLIGMLTVPGGAILSAPLCAEAGKKIGLSADRLAVVNLWFRHVLYFSLPLFPSLILAAQLSGISIGRFVLHNTALTLLGILCGMLLLFRGCPRQAEKAALSPKHILLLLKSLLPLILILVLVVLVDLYFPLALLAGLLAALLNYLPPLKPGHAFIVRLRKMIIPGIKLSMALVIIGVMLYKEMLMQTAVVADLTATLLETGLPVIFLLLVIPFFVGMLTGDNSASVALLFPMFIPLLPSTDNAYAAYLAFLYAGSTAGHIISPAHPCFALTKEFFRAELQRVIMPLLPLLAIVMTAALIMTLLHGYY